MVARREHVLLVGVEGLVEGERVVLVVVDTDTQRCLWCCGVLLYPDGDVAVSAAVGNRTCLARSDTVG